jgi:hypothetical protein
MLSPFGTLSNPCFEQVDFFFRKLCSLIRHSEFRIGMGESLDQLAGIGTAGHDRRKAGIIDGESFFLEKNAKSTIFLHATVAGDAVFIQDWFDLSAVVDFFFGAKKEEPDQLHIPDCGLRPGDHCVF